MKYDPMVAPIQRREDVALFRYALIREAADKRLSNRERGRLVRSSAQEVHLDEYGNAHKVSRTTIDRYIRAYNKGGFRALFPKGRQVVAKTPMEILLMAENLRKEDPRRTGAHIASIIGEEYNYSPSERTIQRHLKAMGLTRLELSASGNTFGRFEADYPNELWVGDALHGPIIGGKKAILFAYMDDYSRFITGHRWTYSEDTLSAQGALRRGVITYGIPGTLYLDNGSSFVSKQLLRALAVLGSRLTHSKPRRPQGRGKIERFFRTVRDQFLVEVPHSTIESLEMLEERFASWLSIDYHNQVHSETNEKPRDRYLSNLSPNKPSLELIREAFLFSEIRTVTKNATISLFSNVYEVDQALCGRKVELVFDPFDLEQIEVRYMDKSFGLAVPFKIGRHSHPMAKQKDVVVQPTGIDYLRRLSELNKIEIAKEISPIEYANINDAKIGQEK